MKTPRSISSAGAKRQTPRRALTRDEQIKKARHLLGPCKADDDDSDDIEFALGMIDMLYAPYEMDKGERSKETKVALKTIQSGLKRAEDAAKKLPWPWFDCFDLKEHRGLCEKLLAIESGPPKREANKQRLAAEQARDLLCKYRQKVTATRKDKYGRKSRWLQLSAILFGDANADMFHHCRAMLDKDRNRK